MPIVRRPSTRLRPVDATVGSIRTSSPSGTTPPVGVATGTAASASGLSQPLARRIMSRRRSPSKCSPTQMPSPSARTTVATFARVQPDSLMRRSSGTSRSSGSDSSRSWNERTSAPGIFSVMTSCSRARAREQCVEVRRLQPDLDVAAVAESAEQVALLREHLQVREADGDLLVDDLAELVDLRRIERPHADRSRRRSARSGCSSS